MPGELPAIYAFVAQDSTGNEGFVYSRGADGSWMALVAETVEEFEALLPIAQMTAARLNRNVRGLKFTGSEQVCVIGPPGDRN